MASTYSTDLKIELMVTGENAGTWGDKTNDNLNVIQQAIAGYGEQSIAGGAQTTNLTIANSPTLSVARNIVIKLTGTITGNQIVTIPSGIEKTWIISNGTSGAFQVQFKTTDFGSSGTIWSTTDKGIKILYSNGTEIFPVDLSTLSGTVASASIADFAVTSAKLNSFAVTSAKLASFAVTTTRLATNAVTAIKIAQSTITQSKLATGSVGADQLIATAVTPGSYTSAAITVDADGRITAASSGAASGGAFVPVIAVAGPTSGTYTKNNAANRLAVYMIGGGGRGGNWGFQSGMCGTQPGPGGSGGFGGYGFFNYPTTTPFSQPYSVGGAGGNTNVTNIGTVNAGNGGTCKPPGNTPGASGNPGNAPGATIAIPSSAIGLGNSGDYGRGAKTSPGTNLGVNPQYLDQATPGSPGFLLIMENIGT
jgi:hypothetical protein